MPEKDSTKCLKMQEKAEKQIVMTDQKACQKYLVIFTKNNSAFFTDIIKNKGYLEFKVKNR